VEKGSAGKGSERRQGTAKGSRVDDAGEAVAAGKAAAGEPAEASLSSAAAGAGEVSTDSVPAAVRQLIELFGGPLKGIEFPGVSGATLGTASAELRARAEALEVARDALRSAEQAVDSALEDLVRQAQQALAYAKVFAAGDPELLQKLGGLRIGADRGKSARGRKPRSAKPAQATASSTGKAAEASA